MAYQKSKGDPTAGPVKTPPPTTRSTSWNRTGYGSNASAVPSSIPPGQTVNSALNVSAPNDPVLDAVKAKGTARNMDGGVQGRTISDKGKTPSFGMHLPAGNPTVPKVIGASDGTPVRKPA